METDPINVTLSPQGAALLRTMRTRRPKLSPAEILEEALLEQVTREPDPKTPTRAPLEVRTWLDQLASLSDKIPARQGETFGRGMIYQDHP